MLSIKEILIVEDDAIHAYITRRLLEKLSICECISIVQNGEEALDYLKSKPHHQYPELILLDILMPIMDGFTFYNKLNEIPFSDSIKVIILTAVMNEKELDRFRKKNIEVLQKPLYIEHFTEIVEKCLEK